MKVFGGVYLGRRDTKDTLGFLDFKEQNDEVKAARKVLGFKNPLGRNPTTAQWFEVTPIYPRRAQSRGITGFCEVVFTVTTTGTVRDARAENCSPRGVFE